MLQPVLQNPWVRAVGVLIALVLVGILGYALKPVLVPLFLALIVAYVLDPVVDFFEARRIPRMLTIIGLAFVAFLLVLSVPLIVVPSVFHQAQDLVASAKNGVRGGVLLDRVLDRLPVNELVVKLGLNKESAAANVYETVVTPAAPDTAVTSPTLVISNSEPAELSTAPVSPSEISDVDARALLAEYIGKTVSDMALQFAKTHASTLASYGQKAGLNLMGFLTSLGQALLNFALFIANFALFTIVAGYLLRDFDPLKASARTLIPPRHAPKILTLLLEIDIQLRSFLRGQMTVCVCLGVMYTIGFLICGVPFAILIGLFSIGAAFIPFVGVATTAVIAILLTLLQYGLDIHLIGVLIVVGVVQFCEGNILTPKIVGEQVGLNPVWVILAIMVFGNFLGFLGLLLAVPIAAALKVLVVEGVAYYRASPVFEGVDVGPSAESDSTPVEPPRRKKRR